MGNCLPDFRMGYSIIILFLSFFRFTLNDSKCDSFSIGGCKNEEFLIQKFPIPDVQGCQDVCSTFNECAYFASLQVKITRSVLTLIQMAVMHSYLRSAFSQELRLGSVHFLVRQLNLKIVKHTVS